MVAATPLFPTRGALPNDEQRVLLNGVSWATYVIREVWLFEDGEFRILELQGSAYVPIAASSVLPEVPVLRLAHYALIVDQHQALREFRDELRVSFA